jgi:hypothetical protein
LHAGTLEFVDPAPEFADFAVRLDRENDRNDWRSENCNHEQ